jgi:hypothetical protein
VPADQGKYDTLTFWEQVRVCVERGGGGEGRQGRPALLLPLPQP